MPKISEFFGIVIYVYYREHLPPHFHALYGGEEAIISIDQLALMKGRLPPRALGLVMEWSTLHQKELQKVWAQATKHETLDTIEPLR